MAEKVILNSIRKGRLRLSPDVWLNPGANEIDPEIFADLIETSAFKLFLKAGFLRFDQKYLPKKAKAPEVPAPEPPVVNESFSSDVPSQSYDFSKMSAAKDQAAAIRARGRPRG